LMADGGAIALPPPDLIPLNPIWAIARASEDQLLTIVDDR